MSLPTQHFAGTVYRGHHPKWAFDPLSGAGAARFGGRFNPKGVPALYTALSAKTAWFEAQQAFAFKAQPLTLCAYDVACSDVLDLTDTAILNAIGVAPDDLRCPWELLSAQKKSVPSWQVAERLMNADIAAILVPSFAPGVSNGRNLIFWHWDTQPPHQVRVVDDEARLPKDQTSWET